MRNKIYVAIILAVTLALLIFACWKMSQGASHDEQDNRALKRMQDWEGIKSRD